MFRHKIYYATVCCATVVRLAIAHVTAAACAGLFAATPAAVEAADYVIQISVDGLHPGHLQTQIDADLAPHFKRFQHEGAWTNNARTDYTHTITLPNHTSMVTGRPVLLPAGMSGTPHHGYTENVTPPVEETLHNFTNPNWYKASTFDVVHDAGMSTALYASKVKFVIFDQSYDSATGAPHANGSDKIDTFFAPEATATMQAALLAGLAANNFRYTFLHYADLDDSGHSEGWGTPSYLNAIETVDNYLGEVLNLVETDPELAGRTAIVLSADHGGIGTDHSKAWKAANYTIPFYVWGAGVAHGDLYTFNSDTRMDPGDGRPDYNPHGGPDYTASDQPIRNGDGGNLSLALLGLGPVPGSMINSAQDLQVALAGDFDFDNDVDGFDFLKWQRGESPDPWSSDDLADWETNYGTDPEPLAAATNTVPEPASLVLAILVAGGMCLTSRAVLPDPKTGRATWKAVSS